MKISTTKFMERYIGLKTSLQDYQQQNVIDPLTKLGFRKLVYCSCMYRIFILLVYDYIDDIVITGNNKEEVVWRKIEELRARNGVTMGNE